MHLTKFIMIAFVLCTAVIASQTPQSIEPPDMSVPHGSARVEQTVPGDREPAALVASFEGLGEGFDGPHGAATLRNPSEQATYAPDGLFRWMASPAIDRAGNICIGYSFGGSPYYAGQRFAGRLAHDPLGVLSLREMVLVEGQAAQNATRWQDYTQTAMDPSDDCTIWYVGDYLRKGATNYSSRIGAFRMPGCADGR
jgi:hypothetical protein